MHIKRLLLIFFILYLSTTSSAQTDAGARQVALSHSNVALSNDVFSVFTNPAGLHQIKWREFGFYYSPSPFGLKELAHSSAAYHEPFSFGSITIGFSNYGFDLYKENKFLIGFSKNFYKTFFLGISASYNSVKIENYGNDGSMVLSIGGVAYLNRNLRIGFSFENFTRATFGDENNQIPIILRSGISYDIFDKASINLAVIKDIDYPFSVRFGIEYELIKYIFLRAGTATNPDTYSAGIGIKYSLFQLDYSITNHMVLGLTHQAGILVNFTDTYNRLEKIKTGIFGE